MITNREINHRRSKTAHRVSQQTQSISSLLMLSTCFTALFVENRKTTNPTRLYTERAGVETGTPNTSKITVFLAENEIYLN
jgi:hypothetical protein